MTSTVFKTERGNMPDNRVRFVSEGADGRIWIGTQSGLVSVSNGQYRIEDRLIHFAFSQSYKNDMYFLTEEGDVYCYQATTQKDEKMCFYCFYWWKNITYREFSVEGPMGDPYYYRSVYV